MSLNFNIAWGYWKSALQFFNIKYRLDKKDAGVIFLITPSISRNWPKNEAKFCMFEVKINMPFLRKIWKILKVLCNIKLWANIRMLSYWHFLSIHVVWWNAATYFVTARWLGGGPKYQPVQNTRLSPTTVARPLRQRPGSLIFRDPDSDISSPISSVPTIEMSLRISKVMNEKFIKF